MALYPKLDISTIPPRRLNHFREWCRLHGLPEDSQDSYERYLEEQKSPQGASSHSQSRPKASRGPPKYDAEEAATHKRAVKEQLGKIPRPAASRTKEGPTSPPRLRAEAPPFAPSSPPTGANSRGASPQLLPKTLPASPVSWDGAWPPWSASDLSLGLATRLSGAFAEYSLLFSADAGVTEDLRGPGSSSPDQDLDLDLESVVSDGNGKEAWLDALMEDLDAQWEALLQRSAVQW